MRHLGSLFVVLAVVLLGPLTIVRAQEATPPAGAAAPIAGATIEFLDIGQPTATPGQALSLVRITFEPGGYAAAHGHPGAQIWYIDAGTLSTTILEGSLRLTRAPVDGTPTPPEELAPGD